VKKFLLWYLEQVFLALDQFGNAFFLFGWADESVSSRSWRLRNRSRFWLVMRVLVDKTALVIFGQLNHCQKAYESEQLRLQEPPEFRK